MEIRAGLEPVIAAVKGLYPNHLDERTMCREISLRLCGGLVHDQNVVDANSEQHRKANQVVYGRQGRPRLPLVDGLGRIEPKSRL